MQKNKEFQLLRGFAITAVVLIHLFNLAFLNIEKGASGYLSYQLVHSLLQFAVPCFIFLSSLLVSYTLKDKLFSFLKFYKKKLVSTLIPYIIVSLGVLIMQVILGFLPFYKLFRPQSWFYWLAYGKAYTHLYFMSVIIQFYIVAPFMYFGLRVLLERVKKYQGLMVLIIAFLPQLMIYWINKIYIYQYFSSSATLFVWYWCISIIGLWIGYTYKEWQVYYEKHRFIFLTLSGAVAILYGVYRVKIVYNITIDTFHYQFIWYFYVILASLALLYLGNKLTQRFEDTTAFKWFTYIGNYSFEIYLVHPLLTLILSRLVKVSNPFYLFVIIFISYFFIMEFCSVATKLVRNYKLTSWISGKYEVIGIRKVFYTFTQDAIKEKNIVQNNCK